MTVLAEQFLFDLGPLAKEAFRPRYNIAPTQQAPAVHTRMPVILNPAAYDAWLRCEEIPLAHFPAERMSARPVGTYVNDAGHEGPECVEQRL